MAESDRGRPRRGRPVGNLTSHRPRLTVLGSSCSIPRPGRACSSYLIEIGGAAIVADLGVGAFANLIRHRSILDIDAILISHMHADHFIDLIPMRYALKYGDRKREKRLPVFLPPGGVEMLRQLTNAFHPEVDADFLASAFEISAFDPEAGMNVNGVNVRFAPTTHYIPTFAMRFSFGDAAIVYSADTAPDEHVTALASGSNVFVCEATLANVHEIELPRGHVSAREAAAMAANAGVGHLVLSHYPATLDVVAMESDARAVFEGPLAIADDGFSLEF